MPKEQNKSKPVSSNRTHHNQRKVSNQKNAWLWVGLVVITLGIIITSLLLWPKMATPNEISVTQAFDKYQQGAFLLDVRTKDEWNQAHIKNSTLIPLDELPGRLSELPRDRDIVVVCRSGARSKEGMMIIQKAGFSRATCMTGGLIAWKAAGYPLEGSNP